jgi:hypothetical protein
MGRLDILPDHVDPSIFDVNDVLLGTGGVMYTIFALAFSRCFGTDRT